MDTPQTRQPLESTAEEMLDVFLAERGLDGP
jgi:hypothetical protein